MTKEEYQKLLLSDYWKGYSYSLIKERNFTSEDCGKRFYNERNILERINHAEVVKRAKRMGINTEGSTIEILERINRKEMEKYNY